MTEYEIWKEKEISSIEESISYYESLNGSTGHLYHLIRLLQRDDIEGYFKDISGSIWDYKEVLDHTILLYKKHLLAKDILEETL